MYFQIIIMLAGGLGVFLYGMQILSSGMQKAAGEKLRRTLEILTSNRIVSTITGIMVTLIVQSSSTTSVMVIGFMNAGLINLTQGLATMLGANIGTTITSQIISFDASILMYPALAIGASLNFFGKNRSYKYIGQCILGFGLLFLGLGMMSGAMEPLRDYPPFLDLLASFGDVPIMGILAGALFTAIIQSSSATAGVVIALTLQGLIDTPAAISIVLGANIGTSFTAALASIGSTRAAKQAVVALITVKVIGVIIALMIFRPFVTLISYTGTSVTRQVANAHSIFNILNVVIVLPFLDPILRLVKIILPGEEPVINIGTKHLDRNMFINPSVAIASARQEILRMAYLAREALQDSMKIFVEDEYKMITQSKQKEDFIDKLEKDITVYLADMAQNSMNKEQSKTVVSLMHATNDLERIGDHAQNIMYLAVTKMEEELKFSEAAYEELIELHSMVDKLLEKAIVSFEKEDINIAYEVIQDDDGVDNMEKLLRKNHIKRLNCKKCQPESGIIFLDLISNLERAADHGTNLAEVVTGEF